MTFRRKNLVYILLAVVVLTVVVGHIAYASGTAGQPSGSTPQTLASLTKFFGLDLPNFFSEGIANIVYILETVASWILSLSGMLLNYSMNLTLHMHDFVVQTPAIYVCWTALRDITGIFFIFFLLYAAITFILSIETPGFNKIIKNIVIAGVLINFSFFLTGLGIDASNIVSLQLYNAIAPANDLSLNPTGITAGNAGGISDIFMSALKLPALYNPSGPPAASANTSSSNAWTNMMNITLIGITAIMIMITTAISFTLAAAAFVVRFVILLFLLAFSPILFAAFIAPEVKKKMQTWWDHYKSMLLFMPVYLLLMYVAMLVLTSAGPLGIPPPTGATATPGVSTATTASSLPSTPPATPNSNLAAPDSTAPAGSTAPSSGTANVTDDSLVDNAYAAAAAAPASGVASTWYASLIPLGINAVIVLFLLNMPLVVAVSMGGAATSWIDTDKYGAKAIWKRVGGYAGTRTIGETASKLDKAIGNTRLGNTLLARDIRSSTTGALAKAKMGDSRSYEERNKELKNVAQKRGEIDRQVVFEKAFKEAQRGSGKIRIASSPLVTPAALKDGLKNMSESQKLALGKEKLTDPHVLRYLKKSDFDAIKKSDTISEDDKKAIEEARTKAFKEAVNAGDTTMVKDMMGAYDGTDLLGMDASALASQAMIQAYTQNQLEAFSRASNDKAKKDAIANAILSPVTPRAAGVIVPTEGWLRKQVKSKTW